MPVLEKRGGAVLTAGICLAAAGSPLAFFPGSTAPYTVPKLVIVALGAALAWTGLALAQGPAPLKRTPLDLPLWGLAIVLTLATMLSTDFLESLIGGTGHFHGLLSFLLCSALYYAAASLEWERSRTVLRAAAAGGALLAVYGLLQRAGVEPFPGVPRDFANGRIFSASGTPPFLGANLLLFLPVSLHLAWTGSSRERIASSTAGILMGAALVLTLSRGALAGAVLGCAAYIGLSGRIRSPRLGARRWTAFGASALLIVGAAGTMIALRPAARIADSDRVQTWVLAVRTFADHPLLGSGPDTFTAAALRRRTEATVRSLGGKHRPSSPHNDLLETAALTGILGLGAYLWLLTALVFTLVRMLRSPGSQGMAAAAAGSLLGLFVQAKLNPVPLSAWAGAGILAGLAISPGSPDGALRPPPPWTAKAVLALLLPAVGFSLYLMSAGISHEAARSAVRRGSPKEAIQAFERAHSLAPWDARITEDYIRFLVLWARKSPPKQSLEMLGRAETVARSTTRLRPALSAPLHMLGLSMWLRGGSGGPYRGDEAARILDRAQALDPWHLPLLELRKAVALSRGDAAGAKSIIEDIQRVKEVLRLRRPRQG